MGVISAWYICRVIGEVCPPLLGDEDARLALTTPWLLCHCLFFTGGAEVERLLNFLGCGQDAGLIFQTYCLVVGLNI